MRGDKQIDEFRKSLEDLYFAKKWEQVKTLKDGITSSTHLLKSGLIERYFIDMDKILQKRDNIEIIALWMKKTIEQINTEHSIDFLAFIEKEGVGTVGAIMLAAYLSHLTNLPNICIRSHRILPYDKLKIKRGYYTSEKKRLDGKSTVIITDVATTGKELMDTVNVIKSEGGVVKAIIMYYSRLSSKDIFMFTEEGIKIYYMLSEPVVREIALRKDDELFSYLGPKYGYKQKIEIKL